MKSCSAMRQLSKIIIMFCMLLLPHTTDTRFQMSTQEQNVINSLNRDVLLPCIFRTQGDFVETEFIIVTWSHNNKEIARYKAGDVLNTSKAPLFERELQKGNASLLLKNLEVQDKGEYICHVVDAPDEGQIKVRLEAERHLCQPITILNDCALQKRNASLLLRNVQVEDKGEYISHVVDAPDEGRITVRLQVVELPKVTVIPDTLVRDKDQIISCIIDGHFSEDISITWKKNGVPLRKTAKKDDGTFITTESLMLNPVDENDEFTCEVKVMNETISTTKKLKLTGNSISLAVIGHIVLSIILTLILMLILILILMIALYIRYHREKLCMKAKYHLTSEQIEEGGVSQTLNGFKNIKNSAELDPENV